MTAKKIIDTTTGKPVTRKQVAERFEEKRDYIAVITGPFDAGSFARASDKGIAASNVLRIFKADFKHILGTLKKGTPVKVNIFDVTGHDTVSVGSNGCFAGGNDGVRIPLLEVITLTA